MKPLYSDFLVIGGGIAGLLFAIKVSEAGSVTVLTKAASDEANTAYAQGGIASVWSVRRLVRIACRGHAASRAPDCATVPRSRPSCATDLRRCAS